jgi:Trk K+ transport system NAD-binding subunit
MKRFSLKDRIRYAFDAYMSKGTSALICGLAIITILIIAVAGAILILFGINQPDAEGLSLFEALWAGFMHALDAGALGADYGWAFRAVMLIVTIGGIFVMSTLIGVLSSGLEGKLDALRKGRSLVIEDGHTAILGWNDQVFPIIQELIVANANLKKSTIVILAPLDKTSMEDELAERIPERGRTKIVVRSGCSSRTDDLRIVNLGQAKSIIILSGGGSDPDAEVIKTALAVMKDRRNSGGAATLVAEIDRSENIEPARIAAEGNIVIVKVGQLVSRIISQCCRQSGLSRVYLELLDFEGDEIYFCDSGEMAGKTYHDALFSFADCTVMGIIGPDGAAELNPPMDRTLKPGERLVLIASDDDVAKPLAAPLAPPPHVQWRERGGEEKPGKESSLILSWNWKVPMIVSELDNYVMPGSSVTLANASEKASESLDTMKKAVRNQEIVLLQGNASDRAFLEGLDLARFDRIVVMSDDGEASAEEADARSIVTLLHLREMAKNAKLSLSIVSEILDIRNRELAEVAEADDFIVSDRILSLMLAMFSENPGLEGVFEDLFDSDGSEIYLKPASFYSKLGAKTAFLDVVEAAARRGETAIGFSIARHANDADLNYGVRLNPPKSMQMELQSEDRVIVLSRD